MKIPVLLSLSVLNVISVVNSNCAQSFLSSRSTEKEKISTSSLLTVAIVPVRRTLFTLKIVQCRLHSLCILQGVGGGGQGGKPRIFFKKISYQSDGGLYLNAWFLVLATSANKRIRIFVRDKNGGVSIDRIGP